MSRNVIVAGSKSLGVESFGREGTRGDEIRLTPAERADLDELWGMASAALGVRSSQGAIEDRLRRAPPRDEVRKQIVEELQRAGGRAPEGRVVRILVAENVCSRYEARRAISMLGVYGKVERIAVEMPAGYHEKQKDAPSQLTLAQSEWTGFDLKLVVCDRLEAKMLKAMRTPKSRAQSRRELWKRQDAALERECQMMHVGDGQTFSPWDNEPELSPERTERIERATRALEKLSPLMKRVLRVVFVDARQREVDVEAVARCMHVDAPVARRLIAETYKAFRSARKTVIACRAI